MPLYEYECKNCHGGLEVSQSFAEEPLTKCPHCSKNKLFRVISGGAGFYMANRTLGAIADKNTASFSKDYSGHLKKKNVVKKKQNLKLKEGQKILKGESKVTELHKKLVRATPEQRQTYIDKGTI